MSLEAETEEDWRPWRRKMPVASHDILLVKVKIETLNNVRHDSTMYRAFQKNNF
jgi:hypothetical protein